MEGKGGEGVKKVRGGKRGARNFGGGGNKWPPQAFPASSRRAARLKEQASDRVSERGRARDIEGGKD